MKFFSAVIRLAGLVLPAALLFAGPVEDAERAIGVYRTNAAAALDILNRAFGGNSAENLNLIKFTLTERQSHRLYSEFLAGLPVTAVTADEILSMDMALQDFRKLRGDLASYLKLFPVTRFVQKHGLELVRLTNAPIELLGSSSDQPELWQAVRTSFLQAGFLQPLDGYLAGRSLPVSRDEIKNYLMESWKIRHRDILPVLKASGLDTDADLRPLRVFSRYQENDYDGVVREFSGQPPSQQEWDRDVRLYGLDSAYVFLISAFRTGRYREALAVQKLSDRNENRLPEIRLLCYLGLDDLPSARRESRRDSGPNTFFYSALLDVLENPSNGLEPLVSYLENPEPSQDYLPESLMLVTAELQGPAILDRTARELQKSLSLRPTGAVPDLPLFAAYAAPAGMPVSASVSPLIGSAVKFRAAERDSSLSGPAIKEIFLSISRNTNASPFLRSLATYRLRERK